MSMIHVIGAIFCVVCLVACTERAQQNTIAEAVPKIGVSKVDTVKLHAVGASHNSKSVSYTTVEWTDLMPKEDLEALLNPPEYLLDIEDGSEDDAINSQVKSSTLSDMDDRYQQALISTTIKPEFNNRTIRIPAFIVPLAFNDAQMITTFFLVPFFGACLHMPPPPPNQIIFAEYEPGIKGY